MTTLNEHVTTASSFGTHRIVLFLSGDDIQINKLNNTLIRRLLDYTGAGQYKLVWFRVHGGIVLSVAGHRIALPLVRSFLSGYTGGFEEVKELYAGTGKKVFLNIIEPFYDQIKLVSKSYGATK